MAKPVVLGTLLLALVAGFLVGGPALPHAAAAPISLVSVDGPGRAQLPSVNMYDVRHLTVDGIAIRSPFDPFHCERCSFLELRRSAFVGIGDPARGTGPQEGVKLNQSDHVRIVDSYLAGATDNALDMVAVQHAYVARNTIAHAVDWCAYAKGGSTDIAFEGNDVHSCGTGGITLARAPDCSSCRRHGTPTRPTARGRSTTSCTTSRVPPWG